MEKYYERFVNKLDKILTEEDLKYLYEKVYHDKRDYIALKIRDILAGEDREFIQDVSLNRESYLNDVCCQWQKLYKVLTPEQKIITLVYVYNLYTLNPDGTRTYLEGKDALKIIDEGMVNRYKVSAIGHISDYMRELPDLTPSDVLFWLQHEWKELSGDWYAKVPYKDYVSRNTTRFTSKTYQAFSEIFKQAFGREIKCIEKHRDRTLVDDFKDSIKDNK